MVPFAVILVEIGLTGGKAYLHAYYEHRAELAKCADCLRLASQRAARRITRAFDRELRPYGLRVTQFTIFVILSLRGAMKIGELAEALGSERATLMRNLALIAGWIKTEPAEDDARSRIVSVTDAARETVARAFRGWRKAQAATAAAIGSDGTAALRRLVRAVPH